MQQMNPTRTDSQVFFQVFLRQVQNAGHRSQVRSQVTGHRAQGTGHRSQVTGHRAQGTGHRAQKTVKTLH